MNDDYLLLQRYVRNRSDEAFEALMRRHVDLVYSAALRQSGGDSHLAEDITQGVFIVLSRKAAGIKSDTVLPAWLMSVTKLTAANARRHKLAQDRTERKASAMNVQEASPSSSDVDWVQISPLLDDAISTLSESDRAAIVLRYFSQCSCPDIARRLNITTDAAEKRVSRAVEKLRQFFARRGITLSALALTALLAQHSVQAAPPMLVATLPAAVASAGSATGLSAGALLAKGALSSMAFETVRHLAFYGCVVLAAGVLGGAAVKMTTAKAATPAVPANFGPAPVPKTPDEASRTPGHTQAPLPPPGVNEAPSQNTATAAKTPQSSKPASKNGNLKGRIKFKGTPPPPERLRLDRSRYPDCKNHSIQREDLVVDAATLGIKDAVIRIMDVKAERPKAPFPEPVLNQKDCRFEPHVLIVAPGTDIIVLNPDRITHNIHTTPLDATNPGFNRMMPLTDDRLRIKGLKYFQEPEIIKLQCDIHPWMQGYIVVHDPRFAAVSGKDGSFEIPELPPGKFTLNVFHSLGEQTVEIEIKAGETTNLGEIEFSLK
ncbi:MAG TPA: sigma-70 family RNA polymerase sigma factor [Planctomycetota bacterium]|nr:sigma-70 family RNA polymerase sigma factor [Planctomycetota bacterium]